MTTEHGNNPISDLESQLKLGLAHHWQGRLNEAETAYRQVLEFDSDQPQALSMLALILIESSRAEEAEAILQCYLRKYPGDPLALHNLGQLQRDRGNDQAALALFQQAGTAKPDFAPIFNDMAVSLHRLGRFDEALAALDKALLIDPRFAAAYDNRGVILYDSARFRESVEAHFAALNLMAGDGGEKRIGILLHLSRAAYEAAALDVAEQACLSILSVNEHHADALEQLAKVMYRSKRDDEALTLLNRLARYQGLCKKSLTDHPEATVLVLGGVGASHVPTQHIFDLTLFEKLTLFMLSPEQYDAPLGNVPEAALKHAALIFNTVGEVDKEAGQLVAVESLTSRLSIPVLNPPAAIRRTGRNSATALFANIPGLIVPKTRWLIRNRVGRPNIHYPVLIRPEGAHGGEGLACLTSPKDLDEYLADTSHVQFLLTDFYDFKGPQGDYRKYRFIFIDREPYPYHLAIGENWLVHYWRTTMNSIGKQSAEHTFLRDWRKCVGNKAVSAITQIAQHMDLDYGGLDCSLMPNGDVLFFEANACMLVHLDESEMADDDKKQAVVNIRDAMTALVRKTLLSKSFSRE